MGILDYGANLEGEGHYELRLSTEVCDGAHKGRGRGGGGGAGRGELRHAKPRLPGPGERERKTAQARAVDQANLSG